MSESEARISAVIGIAFAVMILVAVFEEYSASRLSVILVLLWWVPMLILHELGHALAAKMLGWRVQEIVIGFGREIWQWQIGETCVRVKLAPVEGYVLPQPTSANRLRLKSTLIYAAGPGIELLLLAVMLLVLGNDYVFGGSNELGQVVAQSLAIAILLGAGFNLLPFSTDGGVSDGLGILSSPFMSDRAIEIRLLAADIRKISRQLDDGDMNNAFIAAKQLLARFPDNPLLQELFVRTLSASQRTEEARAYVRQKLEDQHLDKTRKLMWLNRQARTELHADEPSALVLDLAVQETLVIAPNDLLATATKGAALIMRGQNDVGGEMLADVWRRNNGQVRDAELLAYLAIAANRVGDDDAGRRFHEAFLQVNRSRRLAGLVAANFA
ncbi:MAG: site-2 protease family protein [Woeseiaceae bacterium]